MTEPRMPNIKNKKIESARKLALAKLQSSQKHVDRGLELHENSTVVECYGFGPVAAVDGDAIRRAADDGASEAEIQDLLQEMQLTRSVTDPIEREEFQEAWRESGVTGVIPAAGMENQDPLQTMKRLAYYTYVTDHMPEFLVRASDPADIERAKVDDRHCYYMGVNAVPLTQQWVSLEEELTFIRIFFELGVRMMHLTYNRRNMIGDGCAEPANGGLSDFGKAVVAEMNRVGVIVDVAHSGQNTSLDAAKVSDHPIVASHSGVSTIQDHIRCKTDDVIRAVAESGGYIGICAVPMFLGGNGDINSLLDHVEYVARKFGTDHVAIGTDVMYRTRRWAGELEKVPQRRGVRKPFKSFLPPSAVQTPEWRRPELFEGLAWTNWPMFTIGMVQRGFSDEDIQKIIGGNVLRVAKAVKGDRFAG